MIYEPVVCIAAKASDEEEAPAEAEMRVSSG